MLLSLKLALLSKGIRQTRMAVDLGWDPAKLSRIMNELATPTAEERDAISNYLGVSKDRLFSNQSTRRHTSASAARPY